MSRKKRKGITDLLRAWRVDESEAEQNLLAEIYPELRRLARVFLAGERRGHSFQPSDLIHETYFRLQGRSRTPWQDSNHFFAVAAQCMRRILIEHARRVLRQKRGAGKRLLPLEEQLLVAEGREGEFLALNEALEALEKFDPFKAKLVVLRFFGGFSIPEAANILGCSHATVERHWRLARAWLKREIRSTEPDRKA